MGDLHNKLAIEKCQGLAGMLLGLRRPWCCAASQIGLVVAHDALALEQVTEEIAGPNGCGPANTPNHPAPRIFAPRPSLHPGAHFGHESGTLS